MTQEWAMARGQQEHFEASIEDFEKQMRAAFPEIMRKFGRDIFDGIWQHEFDDVEKEAFDVAASNVSEEIAREVEGR